MKKVLLVSNKIMRYRIPIYNYFYKKFKKENIEFFIISNEIEQRNKTDLSSIFIKSRLSFSNCKKLIKRIDPDIVILFLHLKNPTIWFLIHWLNTRKTPFIYWNHGVNLQDPNNKIKNSLYSYIHNLSDSIILYSENELKYISKQNKNKVFIANNTLYLKKIPNIELSSEQLKKKYNLSFKKIVLFVGRITRRKRLQDLILAFQAISEDIGLVIVGPDLSSFKLQIKNQKNIIYLGSIYDDCKINEIFKLSDVFSIPGTVGLGIVQAFHWGLPIVTERVRHSPEISYFREGVNGFMVEKGDVKKLREKIIYLLENEEICKKFSKNAKSIIDSEGKIENMYNGFQESINYIIRKKNEK